VHLLAQIGTGSGGKGKAEAGSRRTLYNSARCQGWCLDAALFFHLDTGMNLQVSCILIRSTNPCNIGRAFPSCSGMSKTLTVLDVGRPRRTCVLRVGLLRSRGEAHSLGGLRLRRDSDGGERLTGRGERERETVPSAIHSEVSLLGGSSGGEVCGPGPGDHVVTWRDGERLSRLRQGVSPSR
jgi:hypothetical protein